MYKNNIARQSYILCNDYAEITGRSGLGKKKTCIYNLTWHKDRQLSTYSLQLQNFHRQTSKSARFVLAT